MKILGIDFGLRYLGLAISDGYLAEPLTTIQVKNDKEALENLRQICQQEKIEQIILGLPEGPLVEQIHQFAGNLKQATNLPVFFQEEDLSSQEAVRKMIEAGKPRNKRQTDEHMVAACLILQAYLDQQSKKS